MKKKTSSKISLLLGICHPEHTVTRVAAEHLKF
jgi:hypothetical protein